MVAKVVARSEKSWSVPEVAARIGVTTIAVLKQIGAKKLEARKDANGHWQIDESAVAAYEARRGARQRPSVAANKGGERPAHAAVAAPGDGGNGSTAARARRRAHDVFPEFRLVMGDPGDFLRRLDDVFAELRSIRRAHEALVDALTPIVATLPKDFQPRSGPFARA